MAHLSPQARRRLNACLHGQEIVDLAAEIADALEESNPNGAVYGETERGIILGVLSHE